MKKKGLLYAAAACAALYAAADGLLFYEVFHKNATLPGKIFESSQPKSDKPAQPDAREVWLKEQNFTEYTLTNADGQNLRAFYLPAETDSDRYALCAHGYRSRGKREFRLMTKFYHDAGFHVLLVDHRASGDSEGNLITFGKKESEDLLLWLDFIRTNLNANARVLLHGVSMGAATVLMLSDRPAILPNVKFIVSDCAFTGEADQFRSVLASAKVPSRVLLQTTDVLNRLFSGFSFRAVRPIDHVRHACVPILFIHGGADDFVPTAMGYQNYDACTSSKDLLIVDGAGHAESYPKNSAAYEQKLSAFIERYLPETAAADAQPAAND